MGNEHGKNAVPKPNPSPNSPVQNGTLKQSLEDGKDHMSTCYDWSRNEVEPLWLYEHVEAAKWSIDQVADFIRSLQGCSEHADSFIAEEIDGQALMLLREEHMVVAMKMKLGPALKIVAKVDTMKREAMLREHGTD